MQHTYSIGRVSSLRSVHVSSLRSVHVSSLRSVHVSSLRSVHSTCAMCPATHRAMKRSSISRWIQQSDVNALLLHRVARLARSGLGKLACTADTTCCSMPSCQHCHMAAAYRPRSTMSSTGDWAICLVCNRKQQVHQDTVSWSAPVTRLCCVMCAPYQIWFWCRMKASKPGLQQLQQEQVCISTPTITGMTTKAKQSKANTMQEHPTTLALGAKPIRVYISRTTPVPALKMAFGVIAWLTTDLRALPAGTNEPPTKLASTGASLKQLQS
jgi:hypothetical protein